LIADSREPRLLIQRRADSKGPFYRVLPEGRIHAWDGSDWIKAAGIHAWIGNDPVKAGGRSFDWNRNFSYQWRPESQQQGSGDYPFSELEVRHLAEFIHSHRNLFGILGFHAGHAAIVRPPAAGPRKEIDQPDDRVMDELAKMGSEETGFPALPLVELHPAHKRDKYRGGHFLDFAYHHLGIFAFDLELGTVLNSAGISTSQFLAVESDDEIDEHMRRLMQWWDAQEPQEPLFRPWQPFDHPQLGRVEIGGFLYTHLDNPTLANLPETSEAAYRFILRLAQKRPQLVPGDVQVDSVGGSVRRLRLRVANQGELPTCVSNKGRSLRHRHAIGVEFCPAEGVTLLSDQGHADLGHLEGLTGTQVLEWFVSGEGVGGKLCDIRIHGGAAGNVHLEAHCRNEQVEL